MTAYMNQTAEQLAQIADDLLASEFARLCELEDHHRAEATTLSREKDRRFNAKVSALATSNRLLPPLKETDMASYHKNKPEVGETDTESTHQKKSFPPACDPLPHYEAIFSYTRTAVTAAVKDMRAYPGEGDVKVLMLERADELEAHLNAITETQV